MDFRRSKEGLKTVFDSVTNQKSPFEPLESLFVSNIGSEHFIGFAGAGAISGLGVGAWEQSGAICLILLANIFVPVYLSSNVTTIPEYLRKRYNRERISIYITAITLLMYAIIKIAINIYSGTLFIEMAMGWSQYASVIGPVIETNNTAMK